jgi:formylglycine-generating enzyme
VFPLQDNGEDGYRGAAPVGCFAPNGYGLVDMTGKVWEYARDWWLPGRPAEPATDPGGPPADLAARHGGVAGPSVVIKGGSFLCAPNFCARCRPSARQPQELGLGAYHLGFRTVLNRPAGPVTGP